MRIRIHNKERISVITLGCSKNTVDSEILLKQLDANEIEIVHNPSALEGGTVIINTCGFIRDAKQQSLDTILQCVNAKKEGRIRQVIVMGCLSERYAKDLIDEIPDVDKYFGVNDLSNIISHLGLIYRKDLTHERLLTTPSHYAYLKISEGCDRRCAFCAIPLIRGRHRSKPAGRVLSEARNLVAHGAREIILIAQDLTSYGTDLYGRREIASLLDRMADIENLEWIRLHYAYPAGFPRDMIRVMKERENICKYLDIPFQHSSDKVLRYMRRGHSSRDNEELIDFIRQQMPEITLRTTLITGHPGEGTREFRELLRFVEKYRFERLGVFAYSEEEGTYGARKYVDTVRESTKNKRAQVLMEIQRNISNELNKNKLYRSFKVLVDGRAGESYVGRTEGDSPDVDNEVHIPVTSGNLLAGRFYSVRVTGFDDYDLTGIPE